MKRLGWLLFAVCAGGSFSGNALAATYVYDAAPDTAVHLNVYNFGQPFQSKEINRAPGDAFSLVVDESTEILQLNFLFTDVRPGVGISAGPESFDFGTLEFRLKAGYDNDLPLNGFDPQADYLRVPVLESEGALKLEGGPIPKLDVLAFGMPELTMIPLGGGVSLLSTRFAGIKDGVTFELIVDSRLPERRVISNPSSLPEPPALALFLSAALMLWGLRTKLSTRYTLS